MKHMLANVQDHPIVPITVLLIFVALFVSLLFMVFRKETSKMYKDASMMPLNEKGAHHE